MTPSADESVVARARDIRLAVFDVDGVLTDGRILFSDDGRESRAFHVRDGLGLKLLQRAGIQVAIISARRSALVEYRMRELEIPHLLQGRHDKTAALDELLDDLSLSRRQAAFTGDDLPDLEVMAAAGLAVAVADAHPAVAAHAHWRTALPGGSGAAREVCDLILHAQGETPWRNPTGK